MILENKVLKTRVSIAFLLINKDGQGNGGTVLLDFMPQTPNKALGLCSLLSNHV